jgi:uncharacterized repeat protein (TIGR03803 family)
MFHMRRIIHAPHCRSGVDWPHDMRHSVLRVASLAAICLLSGVAGAQYSLYAGFPTTSTAVGANLTEPFAAMTFDHAGNMYGTTYHGGPYNANGGGSLWKIEPSGEVVALHHFGGTTTDSNGKSGPDGLEPTCAVFVDDAGNLFGTAEYGGANGYGIVWEFTEAGQYKDIHDFGGKVKLSNGSTEADGSIPNAGVTMDGAGNLFGTTEGGGPSGASNGVGIVWVIKAGGQYEIVHAFGGTIVNANGKSGPDGAEPTAQIVFDSKGDMFGTTGRGGPNGSGSPAGDGMIWEITKQGVYKDLHDFGGQVLNANGKPGPDGSWPGTPVLDRNGNLFGVTGQGGPNSGWAPGGVLWDVSAGGSYRDLHDFGGTVVNSDGRSGPDGQLPTGQIVIDAKGNLFGTAFAGGGGSGSSGVIWERTSAGAYLDLHDFANQQVTLTDGVLGYDGQAPVGVALDPYGNLAGLCQAGGQSAPGMVWILSGGVTALTLSPSSVTGGETANATISLATPAPAGGLTLKLTSSTSDAKVPADISVPAGKATATFHVTTTKVTKAVSATIKASFGSVAKSVTLQITP